MSENKEENNIPAPPEDAAEGLDTEALSVPEAADSGAVAVSSDDQGAAPPADEPPVDYGTLRVMLVDDEEDSVRLVENDLRKLGIESIVTVPTVEAAYFQMTTDPEMFPHVMILELALPGTSGLQFLAKLRGSTSRKMQMLPAIILTEVDASSVYSRAAQLGISAFLRKPAAPGALDSAIRKGLAGKVIESQPVPRRSWIDKVDAAESGAGDDLAKPQSPIARFLARLFGRGGGSGPG